MLELRTTGADESGGVERLVLFPDAERATWGGVVKGQLPEGTWYRFVVLSNCNHCFDAEGVELIRRDPYAREADFGSAWCAVPPPAGHFPWKHTVPPQEAIVAWDKLNLYEVSSCPPQTKSSMCRVRRETPYPMSASSAPWSFDTVAYSAPSAWDAAPPPMAVGLFGLSSPAAVCLWTV